MIPLPGHPIVVGVVPGQHELVALTAAAWADALGGVAIHFGYADPSRIVDEEFADGSVRHSGLDPDTADDSWEQREAQIRNFLAAALADHDGPWTFHYLAGRADRALTHLARAVDASAIMVGAKHPTATERIHEFMAGSVALRLSRHQHRPVVIIPLAVIDWKAPTQW
jgi:Universal stress protein UspA and related nucleotide-binding proteins